MNEEINSNYVNAPKSRKQKYLRFRMKFTFLMHNVCANFNFIKKKLFDT